MAMWGQPRPGSEAYAVKQEVLRKQRMARERGLDKLLSDAYHEGGLRHYEAWFNNDGNKRWVHPDVSGVVNGEDRIEGIRAHFVEFTMGEHRYKVTSRGWHGERDEYNDLALYMNGQRVFGIHESVDSNEYCTTYRPFSITAYVNDEWVSAFEKLKEHRRRMTEQASIEYAEDRERLQKTKEAFGIGAIANSTEAKNTRKRGEISALPPAVSPPSTSILQRSHRRVGIWIVIAVLVILVVWWAMR